MRGHTTGVCRQNTFVYLPSTPRSSFFAAVSEFCSIHRACIKRNACNNGEDTDPPNSHLQHRRLVSQPSGCTRNLLQLRKCSMQTFQTTVGCMRMRGECNYSTSADISRSFVANTGYRTFNLQFIDSHLFYMLGAQLRNGGKCTTAKISYTHVRAGKQDRAICSDHHNFGLDMESMNP